MKREKIDNEPGTVWWMAVMLNPHALAAGQGTAIIALEQNG
jgi:hypothetical protein